MKSYEEMARYVLEVRDEHEKKQQKRKILFRRYTPLAASFCAFVLIGLGVWKNFPSPDKLPPDSVITTTETTSLTSASYAVTTSRSSTAVQTTTTKTSSVSSSVTTASTAKTTSVTAVSSENVLSTTRNSTQTQPTTTAEKTHTLVTLTTSYQSTATDIETSTKAVTAPNTVSTTVAVTETTTTLANSGAGTRPWSEFNIYYKYNVAYVNGITGRYLSSGIPVRDFEIESFIAEAEMSGIDSATNELHVCTAEAYRIKDMDEKKGIAIKFPEKNEYYLYCRG